MNRYPVTKFILQPLPIFCLFTLKISCIQHGFVSSYASSNIRTIAVPGHVNDVVSVLLFTQLSYLSCLPKLVALRFKKPVLELHSMLVGLF